MIVAIDGPAAAGKGTLARRLAGHFGLALLDTGLLYRAVGLAVARRGGDPSDVAAAVDAARKLDPDDLDDGDLRGDAAAQAASKVAAIGEVRTVLLDFQRAFASRPPGGAGGAVLDGRDIGTVVCPGADVKIFVTAGIEVRTERRVKELRERGLEAIYARVLHEMEKRDARDSGRDVAPMAVADDAFVLDTSELDADAVFASALDFIHSRMYENAPPPSGGGNEMELNEPEDRRRQPAGRNTTKKTDKDTPLMAPAEDTAPTPEAPPPSDENFAELLDQSLGHNGRFEGRVVKGTVISIDNDMVLIDVGLKSEGRISVKEFATPGQENEIKAGDLIDVFVERYEDKDGIVKLSREKARREEAWTELEKAFNETQRVNGVIFGRVKGGFIVDLSGAVAFLPGSQVDIRPVRDIGPLMGTPQPFQILKMDRSRNNIVVSRRAVLEETRAEERSELIANLKEGQVLEGVVKNITDYGAFVDLGGVDGLLHVTDIAWRRINHPTEALQIGETVKVQVIRFNAETQRISLGMKQLEADPWDGVEIKYPVGVKFTGRVTNITDYGAFVELEPGVEGLVHVSEMSWTKKNIHPGKLVSTSQEVEITVLDTDPVKRRISLGLKQCGANPWKDFVDNQQIGSVVEGAVKNITEFGLFIGLDGNIDGMAHLSDLSWDKPGDQALAEYRKGQMVKAKVLDVDVEKERISLGIKQLSDDPFDSNLGKLKKGSVVTCTVSAVVDGGIEVRVLDSIHGFIRKSDLSRERSEQRPDRFAAGEKVDAKITQVDRSGRRLTLSIKAREAEEEKRAMREYGSTDSGARLGDILGAALKEKKKAEQDAATDKPDKKDHRKAAAKAKSEDTDEAKDQPEAKEKAETKAKPKAKAKAKPKAEAEATAEAKEETETKAKTKAKAKPKAKPADKTETKEKTKPKPKAKAKDEPADKAETADKDDAGA